MAPDHLAEKRYIGVLFLIGVGLLGAVLVGLSSEHDRLRVPAWTGGSLICAVEFILFVLSRTSGLPGGYHEAWVGAPEDLLGLVSLLTELMLITTAAASLSSIRPAGRVAWLPLQDRTAVLP